MPPERHATKAFVDLVREASPDSIPFLRGDRRRVAEQVAASNPYRLAAGFQEVDVEDTTDMIGDMLGGFDAIPA